MTQPDSIMSAEELFHALYQHYVDYRDKSIGIDKAKSDAIMIIKAHDQAIRNAALEKAIHQVSGFDFNTCVTIRERIERLKTPNKEKVS